MPLGCLVPPAPLCPRDPPQLAAGRCDGFSLAELAVGMSITIVLTIAIGGICFSSVQASGDLSAMHVVDDQLRRAMNRVLDEVRFSDPDSLSVTSSGGQVSIEYAQITGWSGASALLGPTRTLRFADGAVTLDGRTLATGLSSVAADFTSGVLSLGMTTTGTSGGYGDRPPPTRTLRISLRL